MSWGERSCRQPCRCPKECSMTTCNVNCKYYEWDGFTKPDTASKRDVAMTVIAKTHGKVGRNHPCPCGSGKKFKKCCIK